MKEPRKGLSTLSLSQILALSIISFILIGLTAVSWIVDWLFSWKVFFSAGTLGYFISFVWLYKNRNPEIASRTTNGAFLITAGFVLLLSLVRGFEFTLHRSGEELYSICVFCEKTNVGLSITLSLVGLALCVLGTILLWNPQPPWSKGSLIDRRELDMIKNSELQQVNYGPLELDRDLSLPDVFWKRVQRLMSLRHHTPFTLENQDMKGFCIGTFKDEYLAEQRVLVLCHDAEDKISKKAIERLIEKGKEIETVYECKECRLFCIVRNDSFLSVEVKDEYARKINFRSEEDLISELVHFPPYLESLIYDFNQKKLPYSERDRDDQRTLSDTFIEPHFTIDNADIKGDLAGYLDEWLIKSDRKHIALLSDYGMGKSSYITFFAAKLAKQFLDAEGITPSIRIPIKISLAGRDPATDFNCSDLLDKIAQNLGCQTDALRVLRDEGRLVFLLDAFDEMHLVGESSIRQDHFKQLWSLATPNNKILFTGRPSYFLTREEERRILRLEEGNLAFPTCIRVSLQELTDEQIRTSFSNYYNEETAERLVTKYKKNENLWDLARRPVLMHLILDSLEHIGLFEEDSQVINPSQLLRRFTNFWVDRDHDIELKRRQLLVDRNSRIQLFRQLSADMYFGQLSHISSSNLIELYRNLYPEDDRPSRSQTRENMEADLRTCSFLIPDDSIDGFRFAHKPFFEFFVADWFLNVLTKKNLMDQARNALSVKWTPEICQHIADLYKGEYCPELNSEEVAISFRHNISHLLSSKVNLVKSMTLIPDYNLLANITQVLLYFGENFSITPVGRVLVNRDILSDKVYTFINSKIFGRLPYSYYFSKIDFSGANLRGCDLSYRDLSFVDFTGADFTGGKLRKSKLNGANFTGAILTGTDLSGCLLLSTSLSGANLSNANLSDAELFGTNLFDTKLDDVNFARAILCNNKLDGSAQYKFVLNNLQHLKGANLYKYSFIGADFSKVDLSRISFWESDFTRANLSGTNLSGADLYKAILYKANLEGSNLSEAKLQGANLSEANLQGATLLKANINGAMLEKADLQEADLRRTYLQGANLVNARLGKADLSGAELLGAKLNRSDFTDAILHKAGLNMCDCTEADFSGAIFTRASLLNANFYRAKLVGAVIENHQLVLAKTDEADVSELESELRK